MAPDLPRQPLSPRAERAAQDFIRANLPLTEVPGTGGLRLHLAGPRSGLRRLVPPGETPYWAHAWPGGVALAMHIAAHPGVLAGPRGRMEVWEIGAGSGIAAIAAARTGATIRALEPDPLARLAMGLNAEANGVPLGIRGGGFPLGALDSHGQPYVILAGDIFYDEGLAALAMASFEAQPRAATILVGDIGRRFLPRDRLEPLARYPVRDVGDPPSAPTREGWVFRWAGNA